MPHPKCPHCGEYITLSIQVQKPGAKIDWSSVDWSRSNRELSRKLDRNEVWISNRRSKYATAKYRVKQMKRTVWENVDWAKPNIEIARELGKNPAYVSVQRARFAPTKLRNLHE
jgi:hypothetical protein